MKQNSRKKFLLTFWLLAGAFSAMAALWLFSPAVIALPASSGQATPAPQLQRGVVGGEGATLREAPGGKIIVALPMAAALWITGRTADNTWLQVELDDGRSGWVNGDEVVAFGLELAPILDVEVQAESTPASAARAEIETGSIAARVITGRRHLNLRRGPGVEYGIVGVASNGDELTIVGRDASGDWVLVNPPGVEDVAWAAARYLQPGGDIDLLPVSDVLSRARVVQAASGYSGVSASSLTGNLVFQTSSGGPIMVYNLASGSLRPLTTGMHPAISPDGDTVAFIRDNGGDSGLWLIGINGENEHRIFSATQLRTPAWSPDGKRIVFSVIAGKESCRDVGYGICLPDAPWLAGFPLRITEVRGLSSVDRHGGTFVDLPTEKQAYAPDWGKNGIVYQSQSGLQITQDGPETANRPLLPDASKQDPAWRPDGSAIIFVGLEKDHREIFRVNPDGSGVIALTHPADPVLHPQPVQHVAPAWSPDGKRIVYLSDHNGDWAFYVMDADGRNPRKLPIPTAISYAYQGEQVVDWGK